MRKSDPTARVRGGGWRGRALFALFASLALNGVALLLWNVVGPASDGVAALRAAAPATAATDDRPMEITNLVDEIDRPDPPTREEQKRAEEKKQEESDTKPKGQVVDIAKPALEQRPDEARYMAEYDSKVDRETKSKPARDKAGAKSEPTAPAPAAPVAAGGKGGAQGTAGAANPVVARAESRSGRDGLPVDDDGEMAKKQGAGRGEPRTTAPPAPSPAGQGGADGDGREAQKPSPGAVPNPLAASREMLERAIGAGQGSMDYLKDVDDGESTSLNAKKWKFAPFFNRVKRAVAQEWHPDMVYVRHDPSGNVYGVKDRVSVLRVHLTPDGKLAGSNVIQSSGVDFLDDEAQEAFRKAAPFANPPKDLVEADGQIHFTFAFIFELSGRTAVKVYKYK